jgi:hypothetical protein
LRTHASVTRPRPDAPSQKKTTLIDKLDPEDKKVINSYKHHQSKGTLNLLSAEERTRVGEARSRYGELLREASSSALADSRPAAIWEQRKIRTESPTPGNPRNKHTIRLVRDKTTKKYDISLTPTKEAERINKERKQYRSDISATELRRRHISDYMTDLEGGTIKRHAINRFEVIEDKGWVDLQEQGR